MKEQAKTRRQITRIERMTPVYFDVFIRSPAQSELKRIVSAPGTHADGESI
jgi:hypothetical protein